MHSSETASFSIKKIGIIGLGLIGGSLAKALHSLAGIEHLLVADLNPESLARALAEGCVDETIDPAAPNFVEAFDGCDVLFLCIPPHPACEMVKRFAKSNIGMISDVTSVKIPIMNATAEMGNFIGGHPMAGSEGAGYAAADLNLFKNTTYVICVAESCTLPPSHIEAYQRLVSAIGANPLFMDPVSHDCRVAVISHLPHAAAFALSCIVEESHDATMRSLIGGGFRDTTRIAASSPALWTDIFSSSKHLATAIDEYVNKLCRIRDLLVEGNQEELRDILKTASEFRASIPEGLHASKHGGNAQ